MKETFSWIDYTFFLLMLVISSGTGIYHGIYKKQKTAADYLLGGKKMSVVPIAMSLISSSLSGLTLLSLPADIYRYGITYLLSGPLHILVLIAAYFVYVPVFYKLQVTSIYEYFKIRFNNRIRIFASFLYIVHMMLLLPIFIYVPALALSQVTNVSVHFITPIVCTVCIFYTTLGGIKAAVWTDALQFGIMFGSLVLVVLIGIVRTGGFSTIFEKAYVGDRMNISFDLSFIKRDTFWSATIATFFVVLNHMGTNQGFVQKCLSLPSYKSVRTAMILTAIGITAITTMSMFSGLIMHAHYFGCDPVKAKIITKHEQLLPMYVMETMSFIPGLPGLFISGIFSASLSALSASLNCLAAIIYQDFISGFVSKDTSQERISKYLKLLVVILGILCTGLVLVVEKLGSLLALTISVSAVSGGPLLGLFSAGMLIPMVHSKGAFCGGVVSMIILGWIILGSQWYKLAGVIRYPPLPVSIDSCNETISSTFNQTLIALDHALDPIANRTNPEPPFIVYRISFYYYILLGASMAILVSVIVSYFTKRDKPLDVNCVSPVARFLIKDESDKPPEYNSIEKAIELVNQK